MATTKALFLIMVTASALVGTTLGASYTVGGPAGSWDLKTNYTQWASARRFFPGDSLHFRYPTKEHNVLEVTKAGYDTCNTSVVSSSGGISNGSAAAVSTVIATYQTGNDIIPLVVSSGVTTRYFVCGVAGHCAAGMKLKVAVGAQPPVQCRGRGIRRRCTRPPPAAPAASSAVGGVDRSTSLWFAAVVAAGSLLLCS